LRAAEIKCPTQIIGENVRRTADWRYIMIKLKGLRLVKFFAGVFLFCGSFVWAGEAVISRVPDPSGSFCHLRFPAISEDTLFSDQPMLKDVSEGDIIDAYGPCNFDPLGRDSILQQRFAHRFRTRGGYGND
jgi:hypothetical protein